MVTQKNRYYFRKDMMYRTNEFMFFVYSFIVQELIPVTVKGGISKTVKSKKCLGT